MANKNVEGVWIVTGVNRLDDCGMQKAWGGEEYKAKSRTVTTKAGLKRAINAAKRYSTGLVRIEVEYYTVGPVETYNAELE